MTAIAVGLARPPPTAARRFHEEKRTMSTTPPIYTLAGIGPVVREEDLANDAAAAMPTPSANPQIIREPIANEDDVGLQQAAATVIKISGGTLLARSIAFSLLHGIDMVTTAGVVLGVRPVIVSGTGGMFWLAATSLAGGVLLAGLRFMSAITVGGRR